MNKGKPLCALPLPLRIISNTCVTSICQDQYKQALTFNFYLYRLNLFIHMWFIRLNYTLYLINSTLNTNTKSNTVFYYKILQYYRNNY